MNLKTSAFYYLLLLVPPLSFLSSTKKEKKEKDNISVEVMINQLIKQEKGESERVWQIPEKVTIQLPRYATYRELKHQIIKKSYKIGFGKVHTHQVHIFKTPPSRDNMMQRYYYEHSHKNKNRQIPLVESGCIENQSHLYAIVEHKDVTKAKNIVVFLDYEHSDEIIMLLIGKSEIDPVNHSNDKHLLEMAQNTFREVLQDNAIQEEIESIKATELSYPTELEELAGDTSKEPFHLLKNYYRLSLRISRPKPLTLTIKSGRQQNGEIVEVNDDKVQEIEGVFDSNSYVDDIVEHLKKILKLKRCDLLMLWQKIEGEGYMRLEPNIRLERYPDFDPENIVYSVNKKRLKNRQVNDPDDSAGFIFLVTSKRSTSNTMRGQNRQKIHLKKGTHLSQITVKDFKSLIKQSLQYEHTTHQRSTHKYFNICNKLILYVCKQNGNLLQIANAQNYKGKDNLTLNNVDVELGDTIFAIAPSNHNPNQVSFFVRDEMSDAVVLVTVDTLYKESSSVEKRKLMEIRKMAVAGFQSLKENENGLPVLDIDIVKKTKLDLGKKKNVWDLENGDLVTLGLKEGYQVVTINLDINDATSDLKMAVPVGTSLRSVLKEAERQANCNNRREKALCVKFPDEMITDEIFKELDLDNSLDSFYDFLREAHIPDTTPLYMRYKLTQNDLVNDPSDEEKSDRNEFLDQPTFENDAIFSNNDTLKDYGKKKIVEEENSYLMLGNDSVEESDTDSVISSFKGLDDSIDVDEESSNPGALVILSGLGMLGGAMVTTAWRAYAKNKGLSNTKE